MLHYKYCLFFTHNKKSFSFNSNHYQIFFFLDPKFNDSDSKCWLELPLPEHRRKTGGYFLLDYSRGHRIIWGYRVSRPNVGQFLDQGGRIFEKCRRCTRCSSIARCPPCAPEWKSSSKWRLRLEHDGVWAKLRNQDGSKCLQVKT